MDALHLVVVSDTHLSPRTPEALANWEAVLRYVDETRPDLVVHLGDLSLQGDDEPTELEDARQLLDCLSVPWLAVPGNHDIGDNPWDGAADGIGVTPDRLVCWLDTVGPDRWAADHEPWSLLALNAQLFGSGLDAEAEQWDWFEAELSVRPADRPVLLMLHKPLSTLDAELAAAPPYRFVPALPRQRLEARLRDRHVPLVLSGHVHQFRRLELPGRAHVWAPTTWAVLPDDVQPRFGDKRCGILSISLGAAGDADVELVEPSGIGQWAIADVNQDVGGSGDRGAPVRVTMNGR